ncbi:hypothetical protein GCM10022226_34820 [Sphaerisporangium flaviroseum]|uniref:Resolvase/invertase-type recombinase catalytic domain-containing protein n=1 Tax=Sphaerisporangium flaviroseum TaxID=509199 RepID=A0ABP7I694_9ACTN
MGYTRNTAISRTVGEISKYGAQRRAQGRPLGRAVLANATSRSVRSGDTFLNHVHICGRAVNVGTRHARCQPFAT